MNVGVTARLDHPVPALEALASTQPALADAFAAGWDLPAGVWATQQWAPAPDPGFERPFRQALIEELAEHEDLNHAAATALVTLVEAHGAVMTPHHVCPTPGPTFGAIDCLAALGHEGPLLVLAWSGVPMSNSACSGALCFAEANHGDLLQEGTGELKRQRQAAKDRARDGVVEQRVTLIPASLRDALVYECPAPDRLHEVFAAATPELQAVLPRPEPGERYPAWALRASVAVQRSLTGRSDLWYVDLNRVAARYLRIVLDDPMHPVARLFSGSVKSLRGLDGLSWFYGRRPGKKEKVSSYHALDLEPGVLREGLTSGALCPGLVPIFGALRLLSRVRLLGGFRQVLYLEAIADAWRAAGLVKEDKGLPGRLLTGRLTHQGRPVYPLDVALGAVDRSALPTAQTPMSQLWEPLLPRVQTHAK